MRHNKKFNHLSRKKAHRDAMLSNMTASLILHKRIITTVPKAKALRVYAEPIINRAKNDDTHSRRIVFSHLQNKEAVNSSRTCRKRLPTVPVVTLASSSWATAWATTQACASSNLSTTTRQCSRQSSKRLAQRRKPLAAAAARRERRPPRPPLPQPTKLRKWPSNTLAKRRGQSRQPITQEGVSIFWHTLFL